MRLAAGLGGFAVALVVGGLPAWWSVRRWRWLWSVSCAAGSPPRSRARRLREVADLPLAADLLGRRPAGGRAGRPRGRRGGRGARRSARRAPRAGRAFPPPGRRARGGVGALAAVAGAGRMAQAAVRSSASGGALAGALTRLADDLRADRAVAGEAAARRAGVLIVLPLGLCFLPAFLLAGLVPVLIAVLGDVL